jgi:RNA polymerase sigma-70 factor (ECF subfamily)
MNELAARWSAECAVNRDEALVREFELQLSACSALVVRVAYSVLRNPSDAEDVAQEAFLRAYRRMRTLRDPAKFRPWIVRVAWRLALDWRRTERRRGAREEAMARITPTRGNAEEDAAAEQRRDRLWTAIDALPSRLRLVLVLAAIDGHGLRDVASLAGIPEGTVKSRLFEARRLLQEQLR